MRILVFGDSLVYGSWAADFGWVELLKQWAHRQTVEARDNTKMQVYNLGIGGNSSSDILARMKGEINSRKSSGRPLVLIFSFGTNDERITKGEVETGLEQFNANVKAVILEARAHTDKILFVGSPPLGKPLAVLKEKEYSDERLAKYENCLINILEAEKISYVQIRAVFERAAPGSLYSYDGLHPNDAGHKVIFESVLPLVEQLHKEMHLNVAAKPEAKV